MIEPSGLANPTQVYSGIVRWIALIQMASLSGLFCKSSSASRAARDLMSTSFLPIVRSTISEKYRASAASLLPSSA